MKMEKQIEKTSKKNQTTSWSDLPQDVLGIILGKLQRAVDLIRCRAVCKNWRIPRDRINRKNPHVLPSLCNLSEAVDHSDHLQCETFDPYFHQVFTTWKSTDEQYADYKKLKAYGSKQGWLIVGNLGYSMFMYSPNTQEIISLPSMEHYYPRFALFSGNPVSRDCQVFVFCMRTNFYYIASYCLNVDKEWRFVFLESSRDECYGMQYMNERLYCLFVDSENLIPNRYMDDNLILKSYSLADRCWTLIGRSSLEIDCIWDRLWLIKGEGDVLLCCKINYKDDVCSTFYLDWCSMSWVKKDVLEGSAIFVSGKIAMMRPLVWEGENAKDCRVFYFKGGEVFNYCRCYSFIEKRVIESPEYNWIGKRYFDIMAFVEDPVDKAAKVTEEQ